MTSAVADLPALRLLGAEDDTVVWAIDRPEAGANQLVASGVATRSVLTKRDLDFAAASRPSR